MLKNGRLKWKMSLQRTSRYCSRCHYLENRILNGWKRNDDKNPGSICSIARRCSLLAVDQNNPNRTTLKQQKQIWRSLQKYGWTYPILTNKEGPLVDGEQR